jgi:hypothetical protein
VSTNVAIAALLLVGMVSLPAFSWHSTEQAKTAKAETLQDSREFAARSYDEDGGPAALAHIALRPAKTMSKSPPNTMIDDLGEWLTRLGLGKSRSTDNNPEDIEVFARLKSGQEVIIDRIARTHLSDVPLIVDFTGSVVGYFLYSASKEDIFVSSRGTFVVYFVRKRSLVQSSGELRCRKVASKGEPRVRFSNARWDDNEKALTVDVRSSCGVVDFFGGQQGRKLLNLSGLDFSAALEDNAYRETGSRIQVSFGSTGEIASADIDDSERRAMRQCLAETEKQILFRVCGPDENSLWRAIWRRGDEVISPEIGCRGNRFPPIIDEQRDYFLAACDYKTEAENRNVLEFEIAHQQLPRLIEFDLECICASLTASRFHFDLHSRAISFNLKTDATAIRFEGGEFRLPTVSSEQEGRNVLSVPVFSILFNERWQVIGITAVTHGAAVPSGTEAAEN